MAILFIGILSSCHNSDSLTICSFYTGNDYDSQSAQLWDERLLSIESLVKTENFDIIGMQEVNFDRFFSLTGILTDYDSVLGDGEDRTDIEELAPIFFKSDQFILLSKSQYWLSETPDIPGSKSWGAIYPRIVTWAKLQNKTSGHIFFVFNTHFCHLNEDAQIKSSTLFLQKMNEIAGDAPVVVTGNFNASAETPVETLLTLNWDRFHSLRNTAQLAKKSKKPDHKMGSTNGYTPTRHTDHIFVNSYFNVHSFNYMQSKEIESLYTGHRPVFVELKFLFERMSRNGTLHPAPWEAASENQ
ncbi:Bacillopeptidase F precursor [Geofilum rubicundum JCM 15548]|uniref:Bacillopeptidase F n=1 Tax=Geofilum rubicundum JCM 15548 TaxID=1236989 RepID=A0A0E9LRQ3_9BACT|nr:Bacillopeptidase F precursor [Geofilum rubicundum JCM 15548]